MTSICCEKCACVTYERDEYDRGVGLTSECKDTKCKCHQEQPKDWREEFSSIIGKVPKHAIMISAIGEFCLMCGHPAEPNQVIDQIKAFIQKEISEAYTKGRADEAKTCAGCSKEKIDEARKEEMFTVCGKLAKFPDKIFKGGCGEPVSVMKVYACVDCSTPFHRKCLLKHFQEDMPVMSLTKMPLEEALAKVDQMNNSASLQD